MSGHIHFRRPGAGREPSLSRSDTVSGVLPDMGSGLRRGDDGSGGPGKEG